MNTCENKNKRLNKILEILKSWKGKKPDYENLDTPKNNQTEDAYQEEQKKWLEEVKQKKTDKKKN